MKTGLNLLAAHCVKGIDWNILPNEVIGLFGAYNLSNHSELGRVLASPEKIKVHHDWDPSNTKVDADIAILTFFPDTIKFSGFTRQISLWNEDVLFTPATEGYVAGWGKSNHSGSAYEDIPTKLKVPIHTNEYCWYKEPKLLTSSSLRTFCAGSGDGSGVCKGDSGGGLSIQFGSTFYLYGIVSTGLFDNEKRCDVNSFGIDQVLNHDDSKELAGTEWANLKCTIESGTWSLSHGDDEERLEICKIKDQTIDGEGMIIAVDPNLNVQALSIKNNKEVKFLPHYIVESFPGLIVYEVWNCFISTVNEDHFKGLNELRDLSLSHNQIESIDGNSFKDLTKLGQLDLEHNKIKMIDPNWLKSLGTLRELSMSYNQIETLDEQVFDNLQNLREISLSFNSISTVPANLLKHNLKLLSILLSANEIETISSTMFNHLRNLTYVDLQNNYCVDDDFVEYQIDGIKNTLMLNCKSPI